MDKKASVFKENYEIYLSKIRELDFFSIAKKLGLKMEGESICVPFFNKRIMVNKSNILDESNRQPMYSECVVIAKYLLMAQENVPEPREWVTYKDFKDAAPFAAAFSNNVERAIEKRFSNRINKLREAGEKLGGKVVDEIDLSYELIMKFFVLPGFHLLLVFNDQDEEFPADARILFPDNSDKILDMECLAICGWLLSDYLYILSGGKGFSIM
ncbi:hypothetical protein JCM13304A_00600 [Desulfothermus okinawensis JCM 13304]